VSQFTPKVIRKRFHLAGETVDAIRAVSNPLREARDAFVQETTARIAEMDAEIKAIEAPLYDLEQERAACARAVRDEDGKSRMGDKEEHCTPAELAKARKV
jgi:hypothetical protein